MMNYFQKLTQSGKEGTNSSRRFIFLISSVSLCVGFLMSTVALITGVPVSDAVILGLGTVVAGLGGIPYTVTKQTEIKEKNAKSSENSNDLS